MESKLDLVLGDGQHHRNDRFGWKNEGVNVDPLPAPCAPEMEEQARRDLPGSEFLDLNAPLSQPAWQQPDRCLREICRWTVGTDTRS